MKLTISPQDRVVVDLGAGDTVTWHTGPDFPKPFIHPITVSGETITLASPHDHVHHRGAMFAMKVDGVNYWEEGKGADFGVQRVNAVRDIACETSEASFTLEIDWTSEDGEQAQLKEYRAITVRRPKAGGVLITWQSVLHTVVSQDHSRTGTGVELSGFTPHSDVSYYGLGVRFQRALDIGGVHRNAAGGQGVDETHGRSAAWHAYSARQDETGTYVGLAIFDHPDNPRYPTEWFTMQQPFAYVSASLVATKSFTLLPNEPLKLTYGLWAHQGHVDTEVIDLVYRDWSDPDST